jgi:hypothetical protein
MPAAEVIHLETQSERLGRLWRSQGEDFLAAQAAELIADVDRLRETYVAHAKHVRPSRRPPQPLPLPRIARAKPRAATTTIDLRDDDVSGMACSRHGNQAAAARCENCRQPFCGECVVRPEATHGPPLCTECALVLGGVHHKKQRPLVAPGRAR